MKLLRIVILLALCSAGFASEAIKTSLNQGMAPKTEIAELEARIAATKESGFPVDPAWSERIRELLPLVKGHPGNVTYDLQQVQMEGGFEPGAVIRPLQLTPLEQQIRDLEFQFMGGAGSMQPDEVTMLQLKTQLGELYAQRAENRVESSLDQGADVCPATVVTGLPYTDTGTTVGRGDNYESVANCAAPFTHTPSPDVIYQFTPTFTSTYTISLCGSLYDTYMFIRSGGACPGTTEVACNDDACGVQSRVTMTLAANTSYYIVVDGFSNDSGQYTLTITNDCQIACQPGDVTECTEVIDPSHAANNCNGGCENEIFGGVQSWQDIQLHQTVCGRVFTYFTTGDARDIDAYRVTLTEPCSLAVTTEAEFGFQVLILSGSCPWSVLHALAPWYQACLSVTQITPCLPAGQYTVLVLPTQFSGINEFREYRMRVDPVPCSGCKLDGFVQAPGSVAGNTCGAENDNSLRPSEDLTYYVNIPYESDWTFSICGGDPNWDSYIYLGTTCNGGEISQDDDGCGGVGLSVMRCVHLLPGTYYATVEGFDDTNCGPFTLNISECIGSCCYGDPGNPICDFTILTTCQTLGGTFTEQEPCSSGACYTRPQCSEAAFFGQLPYLPDEPWNGFLSHVDYSIVQVDNYSAPEAVAAVRFWGFAAFCTGAPETFQITFDSPPNSCNYTVTTTGTQLSPLYIGTYNLTEYYVELDPPCGIPSGNISIAKVGDAGCEWYWSTGMGDGIIPGVSDFAFCLGGPCPQPDSLTVRWIGLNTYRFDWYVPQDGVVTLHSSTDPNAVFPAGYSVLAGGFLPAGHFTWQPISLAETYRTFVLTMECGPQALQAPTETFRQRVIE